MPLPEKCRNLLTICRKAGKLEAGFARAKDAIQGGVQTDWEMAEVRLLFGQRAGILTICEAGFAQRIQALLQTESSSSNG